MWEKRDEHCRSVHGAAGAPMVILRRPAWVAGGRIVWAVPSFYCVSLHFLTREALLSRPNTDFRTRVSRVRPRTRRPM